MKLSGGRSSEDLFSALDKDEEGGLRGSRRTWAGGRAEGRGGGGGGGPGGGRGGGRVRGNGGRRLESEGQTYEEFGVWGGVCGRARWGLSVVAALRHRPPPRFMFPQRYFWGGWDRAGDVGRAAVEHGAEGRGLGRGGWGVISVLEGLGRVAFRGWGEKLGRFGGKNHKKHADGVECAVWREGGGAWFGAGDLWMLASVAVSAC